MARAGKYKWEFMFSFRALCVQFLG